MQKSQKWRRSATAMAATGGVLVAAGMAGLVPSGAVASSHREAPLISGLPQYDNTDTYAFVSPDHPRSVTLVANWIPFEEPAGGPNFYSFATDARYNLKIDNNGDSKADITYRWKFRDHYRTKNTFLYNTGPVTSLHDKNLNFYQTYTLTRVGANGRTKVLAKHVKVAPSNVGKASMPNYAKLHRQAIKRFGPRDGFRAATFAGQADDSFFLDLRVFDLLYGGDLSEVGDDSLAGFNVNTIALQVGKWNLARHGHAKKNPIIGVWSTTDRRGVNGKYHQISRLGMPLVNEVVIPTKDKDRFNASKPSKDGQFLNYVNKPELPQLIEAVYGVNAPKQPRDDLISVFLTGVKGLNQPKHVTPSEQLRLNMSIKPARHPKRLGVLAGDTAGYPNGRRLADDVVDISLKVVEGALRGRDTSVFQDGVNRNDKGFKHRFPYVALPTSGSKPAPHPHSAGITPFTGGNGTGGSNGSPSGVPVLPISAILLGLAALAGAGVSVIRRPKVTAA
jgi:Domain of unknown function (DUF4331)